MDKKIIVADDDFEQRDLYFELFRASGFEVTPANDGLDAWEKIQNNKPDLVFTGILMPRMTGFDLIQKLRDNPATATVPVIIFSHLGRPEDRKQAAGLPGVTFVVKGYDRPVKILETAKNLLNNFQNSKSSATPNPDDDDRIGAAML